MLQRYADTAKGMYHASKAATASISETLRLELEPIGFRVVTAMVGEIKTKFYRNASAPELPFNSFYKPAIQGITRMATGALNVKEEDPDVFAVFVVAKIVGGATGRIWKGGNAGLVQWATAFAPTTDMVSLDTAIFTPLTTVKDSIVCKDSDLEKVRR